MAVTNYDTLNGRIRGQSSAGARTDFLTDALGSVTATVDPAAAVVNTYRNKAYGVQLAKTGAGVDPKFLWAGDTGSRNTGLGGSDFYNRARHYGAGHATWTSPLKSLVMVDNGNTEFTYSYAYQNPTTFIDPNGLKPVKPSPQKGSGMGSNFGNCGVYICAEHTMGIPGFGWVASHKYVCVTGPGGGCAGGIYPDSGAVSPGHIENSGKPCPSGDPATGDTCTKIASTCAEAQGTCACVKRSIVNPGYYVFGLRDCYHYPEEMLACACGSVTDPAAKKHCDEYFGSNQEYV